MNKDILGFCTSNVNMKDILEAFTEGFLFQYNEVASKDRQPLIKAMPYLYRIWYYSVIRENSQLTPSNFINTQVEETFGEGVRVVPIINPVFKNRVLKGFSYDYKLFTKEEHPVLEDMKMFLEHCSPDIGIDETGLLLQDERDEIINDLTFKEIFYVTFLTNTAYELNLLKKMPSIGIYRAMPNPNGIDAFFNLSKEEQLEKLTEAVISRASKAFSQSFSFDRLTFSKKSLTKLLSDSQDLDDYSDKILKKFNVDIDIESLSELLLQPMSEKDLEKIPEESLFGLAFNVEFSFIMDAFLLTPLGHYLQLIQPIYKNPFDFFFNIEQLIQANTANIPIIKLYFIIANGFDITSLGKEILLHGNPPKNEYQKAYSEPDLRNIYKDFMNYINSEDDFEGDDSEVLTFGGFKTTRKEMRDIQREIEAFVNPRRGRAKIKEGQPEIIKDNNLAYTFKVKHFYNKRSFKSIELKGSQTLEDLAIGIIKAFNLEYGHLYSFFMSNKAYDKESEITCPLYNEGKEITTAYKIYKLGLYKKKKFLFIHDFGDDIRFEVEFINTSPIDKKAGYPRIVNESKNS